MKNAEMSLLKEKRESLMGLPILSIQSASKTKFREITTDYKIIDENDSSEKFYVLDFEMWTFPISL